MLVWVLVGFGWYMVLDLDVLVCWDGVCWKFLLWWKNFSCDIMIGLCCIVILLLDGGDCIVVCEIDLCSGCFIEVKDGGFCIDMLVCSYVSWIDWDILLIVSDFGLGILMKVGYVW